MSIIYLNGEYKPIEEATVSVMDRGFLFGDGVYEVIPVYGGCLFRLREHLARLEDSLGGIRLDNPYRADEWETLLRELVTRNGGGDQSVYMQITRGVIAKRDHGFPKEVKPTVFAMSSALPENPRVKGIAAITARDIRWDLCNIKAITLLPNALLRQQAMDAGAMEAILSRDGFVTEGAASNVFIVHSGKIATPPKSAQLLPGITRDLVVELLAGTDTKCTERRIGVEELSQSDEIWVTSSTREIVPVLELDGKPVGAGVTGPVWQRTRQLYSEFKAQLRRECGEQN
ncbi:MAG: D-amino acid aminotransferase [Gammaproteobacteria bacterium]|nr:D-amino acid aminotransferase [Gammaproteobacteria bacterium]